MKILVVQDGYCYQPDKYRETNCASYPVVKVVSLTYLFNFLGEI